MPMNYAWFVLVAVQYSAVCSAPPGQRCFRPCVDSKDADVAGQVAYFVQPLTVQFVDGQP